MRKTFTILIILMLASFSYAISPDRAVFGVGNDLFSVGLSRNDDDQLTFSLNSFLEFDRKKITLDYNSIVNRGWKNGWSVKDENASSSEEFFNGRFDELQLIGSHSFTSYINKLAFNIEPYLGIHLFGNFGSEYLQNTLHRIISIHSVKIPYEGTSITVRPLVALESSLSLENQNWSLGTSSQITLIPSFRATETMLIDSSFYSLNLSLGYGFVQSLSTSQTDRLYCEYTNGTLLKLEFKGKIISGKYRSYLSTGFGFGQIGVNMMSIFDKSEFSSPLSLSIGKQLISKRSFNLVDLSYQINDKIQLVISDSFIAGDPVDHKLELNSDLRISPRTKLNNAFFMTGLKYLYRFKSFNTYSEALIGVYKSEKTNLYTTVIDSTVPCKTLEQIMSFCAQARIGASINVTNNLGLDVFGGLLLAKMPKYQTNLSCGFSLVFK